MIIIKFYILENLQEKKKGYITLVVRYYEYQL